MIKIPKLSSTTAAKVDEAESGNFEAVPEGIYLAVLDGEVATAEGAKGPYWKWTFKVPEGEEYAGRKFFTNTSLAENAFWKLKELFEAFGVPTTTDTDDLIGKPVRLMVVQKIIEQGTRKGQMGNEVQQVLPADPNAAKPAAGSKKAATKAQPDNDLPVF